MAGAGLFMLVELGCMEWFQHSSHRLEADGAMSFTLLANAVYMVLALPATLYLTRGRKAPPQAEDYADE